MLKLSGCPRLTWGRVARRLPYFPTAPFSFEIGGREGDVPPGKGSSWVVLPAGRGARHPAGAEVHQSPCPVPPAARTLARRARGAGGQSPHPPPCPPPGRRRGRGATRGVTPRQACPRPEGFGRNLRSKTRWFTGFCNSHQVSHFATFFIDARAEISVAESRKEIYNIINGPERRAGVRSFIFIVPWRGPRRGFVRRPARSPSPSPEGGRGGSPGGVSRPGAGSALHFTSLAYEAWNENVPPSPIRGRPFTCSPVFRRGLDNDPSAGSPTETLLRLLLPLNDKVQWTSRDVAGGGPPSSPRSEHFTGPFNR